MLLPLRPPSLLLLLPPPSLSATSPLATRPLLLAKLLLVKPLLAKLLLVKPLLAKLRLVKPLLVKPLLAKLRLVKPLLAKPRLRELRLRERPRKLLRPAREKSSLRCKLLRSILLRRPSPQRLPRKKPPVQLSRAQPKKLERNRRLTRNA